MAIILTFIVAACAFSIFVYIAAKFANDGRKYGVKWYSVAFPLVIFAAILLLSYLGYGVILDAVANSRPAY